MSAVATTPPIVAASPAPSGGSSASIWPASANAVCASASRTPASRTAVRSPALCSRIAVERSVETSVGLRAPPHASFVPPPPARPFVPSPGAFRELGGLAVALASEPLRDPGRLERMLPIGPGNLAAEPRRRHHLPGVRAPLGVEGAAELLERGEIVSENIAGM